MAMKDILQMAGKQLKNPYIRRWYYGKGDDTYRQTPATKTKIKKLLQASNRDRGQYYIAYKGMEYGVNEYVKKYPKMALLKSKIKKRKK